jgi:acetylornithine/succinyldiaminopimelate/putrescine aminotransferase
MERGKKNRSWIQRLKAVECGDSTMPEDSAPLVFSKAHGSTVIGADGESYLDLCAGFGSLPFGHDRQSLLNILSKDDALVQGMGDVYASTHKVELVEKLVALFHPRSMRASLSISGAQAIETALKTAMLHTKNTGFVSFQNGYHGVDLGVLPVTFRPDFREPFQKYLKGSCAKALPLHCSQESLDDAIEALEGSGHGFAGVIIEPIQGRAGVVPVSEDWLRELKAVCEAHNAVLIFDEVFCGFGRTGMLPSASTVEADIYCFGKAMGGGLPISACVARAEVMESWPESTGEAIHTGTFFGHPLSCALACATIEKLSATGFMKQVAQTGERAMSFLKSELQHDKSVKELRGRGLMLAIELNQAGAGVELMHELRRNGVIALCSGPQGQTLTLSPALNISWEEFSEALKRIVVKIKRQS